MSCDKVTTVGDHYIIIILCCELMLNKLFTSMSDSSSTSESNKGATHSQGFKSELFIDPQGKHTCISLQEQQIETTQLNNLG